MAIAQQAFNLVLVLNEALARLKISLDHLLHQRVEVRRPLPAQFLVRLSGVAEQEPRSSNINVSHNYVAY